MPYIDPIETAAHLTLPESVGASTPASPEPRLGPGELAPSPAFWRDRRVVVTGGAGFLGSHIVERLVNDDTRPDGRQRRCLDTARAHQLFGFRAHMDFRRGLERTVRWYEESRATIEGTRPGPPPVHA